MTDVKKVETRTQIFDRVVAETTIALDKAIPPNSESSRHAKYIAYRLISLGYIYPQDVVRMVLALYTAAKEEVVK